MKTPEYDRLNPYAAPLKDLLAMLRTCRPYRSPDVDRFIDQWILPIHPTAYRDTIGNVHVQVGEETDPILWSAHTDTVHRAGGEQRIQMDDAGVIRLSDRAVKLGRNCLGADDTVGVWILREMILAGVPGRYVFHAGEEVGGVGSKALAQQYPDWLGQCRAAIAFDRRGTRDVITYQAAGRCCSDVFAWSVANVLTLAGLHGYAPNDGGIYTDTAEYTGLVGECTNISCGTGEHGQGEQVDGKHVITLRDALVQADWSGLVFERIAHDPWEDDGLQSWRSWRRDSLASIEREIEIDREVQDLRAGLLPFVDEARDIRARWRGYALDPQYDAVQKALEEYQRDPAVWQVGKDGRTRREH